MLSDLFFNLLKLNTMATLVAIIVLTLKYVLKKCGASRKLLFYLWIIIALRFICPTFMESNLSLFNIFDTKINIESKITTNQTNIVNTNIGTATNIGFNANNNISTEAIANTEINEIPIVVQSEPIISKEQYSKFEIVEILMLIWITVSSCMIFYAVMSYVKLKKTVMFAVKGDGDYYETDMISTPCVLGIIKPKIYLTLNLTSKEKEYILTHENVHIRRKDYLTKLIGYLILTIHWINPFCWFLFKMFISDMEMLCDEESIKTLGTENKVGYMESLVNVSSKNMKNILPCPIAFSESNTEKRVKNMIKYKKSGIAISVIAVILCIIIVPICLTNKQEVYNNVSSSLYKQTEEYLKNEFYRVYTPYYEILDLEISNWNENGNEATFFYKMTYKNYDKDLDTVGYIKEAKEDGGKGYEILKKEYLEPKESNYRFKIIVDNGKINLYSNMAAKGEYWEPTIIDEYVSNGIILDVWKAVKDSMNHLLVRDLANLKYSTIAQSLLPYANDTAVYEKLTEINNQNWEGYKLNWEKAPENIVGFNDIIFDTTLKNHGRFFEVINENNSNYQSNISNEKAIEIINNQYAKVFEEKFDTYTINAEFVLYTDINMKIDKEPVLLVIVQGRSKATEEDKQAVEDYFIKLGSNMANVINIDEYHWLNIYLLDSETGKEYPVNSHTEMGHIAMHKL